MSYLLDTNTCIRLLNGTSERVRDNFREKAAHGYLLCSVVKAELYYGAFKSRRIEHNMEKLEAFFCDVPSLPFSDRAAGWYGRLRNDLEGQGNVIGPNDLMIASIALSARVTLVSHNTREFSRIPYLLLEDWEV